jgi:hypothetical protein
MKGILNWGISVRTGDLDYRTHVLAMESVAYDGMAEMWRDEMFRNLDGWKV